MILLPDQEVLVQRIVNGLTDSEIPANTCLLLPPGFVDECQLAIHLADVLRATGTARRVAIVYADALTGREAYAADLARQWNLYANPSGDLQALFARLAPDEPGFQIILRAPRCFEWVDRKKVSMGFAWV